MSSLPGIISRMSISGAQSIAELSPIGVTSGSSSSTTKPALELNADSSNPFLSSEKDLDFKKILEQPEKFLDALQSKTLELTALSQAIAKQDPQTAKFDESIYKILDFIAGVNLLCGIFDCVIASASSEENFKQLSQIREESNMSRTQLQQAIYTDAGLYSFIKSFKDNRANSLTNQQNRVLDEMILRFELSGAKLDSDQKKQLEGLLVELTKLQIDFEKNINACDPNYQNSITVETDRKKRQIAFEANLEATQKNDNFALEILGKRRELAQLLGHRNFTEFSLSKKMLKNPAELLDLLTQMAKHFLNQSKQRMTSLKQVSDIEDLQPWDFDYAANKVLKKDFGIDQEELKKYFSMDQVIEVMFDLAGRLFGLKFTEDKASSRWSSDVRVYKVTKSDGTQLGNLFLDLYQRDHKAQTCDLSINPHYRDADGKTHLANNVIFCSFKKPASGQASLLYHEDVHTLFHEFGHALHDLCSESTYNVLSSHSVPWDAIEIPSKFFENFAYTSEVLQKFRHCDTKQALSADQIRQITKSRDFKELINYYLERSAKAIADLEIHQLDDPKSAVARYKEILSEFSPYNAQGVEYAPISQFHHAFGNPDDYAAGFYSYVVSHLYARAIFRDFASKPEADWPALGSKINDAIFKPGNTRDLMLGIREIVGENRSYADLLNGLSA